MDESTQKQSGVTIKFGRVGQFSCAFGATMLIFAITGGEDLEHLDKVIVALLFSGVALRAIEVWSKK